MIQIVAVHMVGSEHHQHIESLRWFDLADPSQTRKDSTRQQMVDFVRVSPGQAVVADGQGSVALKVVEATPPYVQTYADGRWTDNLLSLGRY